ncbi:phage tail protein [Sphingobium chungbukense]|uniref:hypothetical protein n=1 Tax=Sphingobium chungbukense TaxID=56193 RepID=UPI00069B6D21|nr:hypothetical protein [Sphingobium chungbukense]
MSKTLAKVAMIAGAVALVATGVGAAAGAGVFGAGATGATGAVAGISTATISTVAQVATVVAAAASLGAQLTAKKPGAIGAVNTVQIGANSPIPYGVGRCFYAGSQLHDVGYGGKVKKTQNPYLSKVFVWSGGGPIDGIEALLMDWQEVSFAGTSALGYYASWLYADHQMGHRPEADALAGPWGAVPDWSAAHKLSGMAASMLSFKFDRDNKVWANGIPAFGIVARFARVYDPRKDSTYSGGAGDHRFDDEDSFEFDRNAALNAITYARGRYAIDTATGEQTMKVIGCGFPKDTFDWPQWVAFANICEANGWNSDGTVFDGPGISLWDNLKRICAAGGGVPVISGGLLSVRFQSPKVALDTITAADFADGERLVPGMRTYRDRINTMVPKYRSEANKWEYVQSDAVSFESYIALDGEPKEEEYLCELVTDKDQAAQLTAYELFNRRELSGITIPCKPRLWDVRLGEAYQVVDPETGLDHLCVVAAISKDISTGVVTLTFETETNGKHALALGMTGTAPPPPTLIEHGEADNSSWQNGGGGDPEIPDADDWTLSSGGGTVPSLVVVGAAPADTVDSVVFEYRLIGGAEWTGASIEPEDVTRKEMPVPAGSYEVAISYRIGVIVGERLILGPVDVEEPEIIYDGGDATTEV